MQNQPPPYQPYQQNNFQQPPKPKSNKLLLIILGLIVGVPTVLMGGCVACLALIGSTAKDQPSITTSSNTAKSTKSYFNAAALTRKSPKEVAKILGNPTDSWTPRGDSEGQMQSYALGEDTTVEFHKNRIKSLVIFFNEKNIDSETAYRLVGLDYEKSKPAGISNITTGEDWIKIFY